jgi:ribonuclease R
MVIPMLPNELSTDLCSLKPMQERPVLAVHMTIDENGNKLSYKFERAMIKSHARLTYSQVQNAYEGITDGLTKPLLNDVINPLYEAYHALKKARKRRKTLEIDVPEKKVYVNENGIVEKISPRERYESHKLIEEFMILANVCAAEEIEKHEKYNGVYRIHDIPSKSKIDNLCETLKTLGIKAISGETFKADFYNKIMEKAEDKPYEFVVKNLVLRSQSQAEYSPDNIGHFGLSLEKYTHFTSPIRRYADLCVHRLLIQCLGLGEGGMSVEANKKLYNICEHISQCERDAMVVERETVDRYVAQYLTDKINATFKARVNGVSRAGLFITLNETGADGLIPMSSLPDDYYVYQEDKHLLYGQASGRSFSIGDELKAELIEIRPIAGGLIFKYLDEKKGANYQSKEDSSNKGRRRKKRRKK